MKYLVIRHAQTDANRLTRALFGKEGAPINEQGSKQAQHLKAELLKRGVDPAFTPIAVSDLLRTKQTAENAGFKTINTYSLLNEVSTSDPQKTLDLVAQAKLPKEALIAARAILDNPPKERLWVTHGLVIAALSELLGLTNPDNFIPNYCEIKEVEF